MNEFAGAPPKRAPRTLTVHDRKINVDALAPEPSMYLLAREWVANNPNRPPIVRPTTLAAASGIQLPAPLPHTPLSLARLVPSSKKRTASELRISSSRASAELILEQHVQHARDVRRWVRVQRQAVLDRFRPRLLKLLCGGQGLQQANMPMPVQPNQPEAQEVLAPRSDAAVPTPPPKQPPSAAAAAAAEAEEATAAAIATTDAADAGNEPRADAAAAAHARLGAAVATARSPTPPPSRVGSNPPSADPAAALSPSRDAQVRLQPRRVSLD
ncbi:hypothetical protein KFE25_010641 [Diacronema lutheri]|uniref:Uncharacterized protein n=1 Tax=Diacronema lutheri TaxID=2081491 RepID=A0A8J5XDS7_DIALT|nr:hypothetical protein KFE25_010641 [Diacronema lutheri]